MTAARVVVRLDRPVASSRASGGATNLSDESVDFWNSRLREQILDEDRRAARAARAKTTTTTMPNSGTMYRTFRGLPGEIEHAFWQLRRTGVYAEDGGRFIEGIAASDEMTAQGSARELAKCDYSLPLPLLYGHDWRRVVGEVYAVERTASHLYFKAKVANAVLEDVDTVWGRIISGKSFGVSTDSSHYALDGSWRWAELSVVERGADPEARILLAKERSGSRETVYRDARNGPRTRA